MNLEKYLKKTPEMRLEQFLDTLSITNRTSEYYVNWKKVEKNTKEFELELHTLNYLLGKENIFEEAKKLFKAQPQLLKVVPTLIASRNKLLDILVVNEEEIDFNFLDFNNPRIELLDNYMEFINGTGLLNFMKNNITKSLVDFVYGVETGLDSNARKNRSGSIMESVLNKHVISLTEEDENYKVLTQASPSVIQYLSGIAVPIDKSERRFDEVIYDKINNRLFLIETNYYGGGGSKLKAVAGEFSELNQLITSKPSLIFIWVTDGQGWKTAKKPMLEAFEKIDFIFNIDMLQKQYLKDLIYLKQDKEFNE